MSLYSHTDYRQGLRYVFDRAKRKTPALTQSRLSELSGIHNTFISNVFKGRSDLHADQIYSLGEALKLESDETEFLVFLMEWEKAQHKERKQKLRDQLDAIRNEKLNLGKQLNLESPQVESLDELEYYLNPWYLIIHTALNIPKFARSVEELCQQLSLSQEYVRHILTRLEFMSYIAFDKKTQSYKVIEAGKHLDKESPLCIPHHTLMRNQGLRQMGEMDHRERNYFSATFPGSQKLREEIEKEFYEFIKKAKSLADKSKNSSEVFQLNFDLFPW